MSAVLNSSHFFTDTKSIDHPKPLFEEVKHPVILTFPIRTSKKMNRVGWKVQRKCVNVANDFMNFLHSSSSILGNSFSYTFLASSFAPSNRARTNETKEMNKNGTEPPSPP